MVFGVKSCCLGFERDFLLLKSQWSVGPGPLLVKFSECMVLWCKKLLPGSLGIREVSLFFCGKFDAWE